jgi:hypothetical protein
MRLVAFRAPCPVPAPAAWSLVDSTLGTGLRCSLVQAAALALRDRFRVIQAPTRDADPWRPLCVRIVELENAGSTGLPGDWLVLFDLGTGVSAEVIVDRQTGDVIPLVGEGVRTSGRSCASGGRRSPPEIENGRR